MEQWFSGVERGWVLRRMGGEGVLPVERGRNVGLGDWVERGWGVLPVEQWSSGVKRGWVWWRTGAEGLLPVEHEDESLGFGLISRGVEFAFGIGLKVVWGVFHVEQWSSGVKRGWV